MAPCPGQRGSTFSRRWGVRVDLRCGHRRWTRSAVRQAAREKDRLVRQPYRQVVHQVRPACAVGRPADVGRPTRQPRQVCLKVGDAFALGYAQLLQGLQRRVVGAIGHVPQGGPHLPVEGVVGGGQCPPGAVETLVVTGHRPLRRSRAEVGRTPLGGLVVDLVGDVWHRPLGAGDVAAQWSRCGAAGEHVGLQQLGGRHRAGCHPNSRSAQKGGVAQPQCRLQVGVGDPPASVEITVGRLVENAPDAVQVGCASDCLLEGHRFQAGQWVDCDEGFHGVMRGYHPCGEVYLAAHL